MLKPPDPDIKSILTKSSQGSSHKSGKSHTSSKMLKIAWERSEKEKKEREAHPERRLLFRPKVYEAWKDEDIDYEIIEREALIAKISAREADLKKKKADGEIDSDDEEEDEDSLEIQKAALEHLKHRKEREQAYRERLEAEQMREDQEKAAAAEEKALSELQNPSVFGWFCTDGYYENAPFFGVKNEILDKMNEEQEVWKEKWLVKHPESFTEKFKRYFWPPKLRFKKMFRTRGKYMDFPEVIADWPPTMDVNFEKGEREIVTNRLSVFQPEELSVEELEQMEQELEEQLDPNKVLGSTKIEDHTKNKLQINVDKSGKELNWDDWYYDDKIGEFLRKTDALLIEYYMDNVNMCWRHKRPQKQPPERQPTPYDWYFDLESGNFIARADFKGLHMHEFIYDPHHGVYVVQPIAPTGNVKAIILKTKTSTINKDKIEKNRKASLKGKNTSKRKVSDYFFDEEEGNWQLKSEIPEERIEDVKIQWDENGKRFVHKVEGSDWRGLTGFSPDDYYFDDRFGRFILKPARQGSEFKYCSNDGVWRKESAPHPNKIISVTTKTPNDFYFDEFEGQFKEKAIGAVNKYWKQKYSLIWRKHDEPKSGMYPEDYYWDRDKKLWLPRSIRMDMLKNTRLAKTQWASEITRGAKTYSNIDPSSYFWDIEEGIFSLKSKDMKYYMDTDGFWKSTKLRDRERRRLFPYDFYYDPEGKGFARKQKDTSYVFNKSANIWTLPKAPEKLEISYYFDVAQESWLTRPPPKAPQKKKSVASAEAEGEQDNDNDRILNNGIFIKPHSKEKVKTPDEFWFDESEGRFYLKEPGQSYYYNSTEGVWKKEGNKGPNPNGLHPRNYFFDDSTNRFKLQVANRKQDYWYDNNNKIFRHVVSVGATRSGYQPTDFAWNSELNAYALDRPQDKNKGKVFNEQLKWDPMRRYSKGWEMQQNQGQGVTTTASGTKTLAKNPNIKDKKPSIVPKKN